MEKEIIYLIIYVIGYFVGYISIKLFIRPKTANDWGDVSMTFALSLFSWIVVFFGLVVFIFDKLPKKPPKYL